MTRLSKRYIALLCAVVIALSMSGCQNMQGPAAGPAAEGTSDAQTSMEAQVGETDQEAAPFTSPDEAENRMSSSSYRWSIRRALRTTSTFM